MARTYASQWKNWSTCETPYCGSVNKYFCVKCRKYVLNCRCGVNCAYCACEDHKYWAARGERPLLRKLLVEENND